MDWRRLEATRAAARSIALAEVRPSIRDFTHYLGAGRRSMAVVPLILRRDPATGAALAPFDAPAFAAAADDLEIAGIAVATEPTEFGGRLEDLRAVGAAATAPILRFDCVSDERRLYESRAVGADAVLVPVAVVGDLLPRLVELARAIHVTVVAEVATTDECDAAVAARVPIIVLAYGRLALAAHAPTRIPLLAEDAAHEPSDLAPLVGTVDGVIIGAAILGAPDPLGRLAAFLAAAGA